MRSIMLGKISLAFAALALAGTAASGAEVTIYSNLAVKDPNGVYWCCSGIYVNGPTAIANTAESWKAVAFTPTANHVVTRIAVAAGHLAGTNGLVLSLNSDKDGEPGRAIKNWNLSALPNINSCCTLQVVKTDRSGIPVSAGVQYWVVLKTNKNQENAWATWDLNVASQLVSISPTAVYCSADVSGTCPANLNDKWRPGGFQPAFAFGVFGR
jgi:hypothetical protein